MEALQAKPLRNDAGQLVPGQGSLNPGGKSKRMRELDELIALCFGPKCLTALQRLFEIGTSTATVKMNTRWGENDVAMYDARSQVAALTAFLLHVKGAPRPPKAGDDDEDADKLTNRELWERILAQPAARAVALEVIQGGKK